MNRTGLAVVVLLAGVLIGALVYYRSAQAPTEERVAEPVDKIVAEFKQRRKELVSKQSKAKTVEERRKAAEESNALQKDIGERLLVVAKADPKSSEALEAIEHLTMLPAYKRGAEEAAKLLSEHHVNTPGIADRAAPLVLNNVEGGLEFARAVAERNPEEQDRAKALWLVANYLKEEIANDRLQGPAREEAKGEAVAAFETLAEKYASVEAGGQKLGPIAKGLLVSLQNLDRLVIGNEAPDLAGPDLDGKDFKLSDYRGKVVLLDFWAHW